MRLHLCVPPPISTDAVGGTTPLLEISSPCYIRFRPAVRVYTAQVMLESVEASTSSLLMFSDAVTHLASTTILTPLTCDVEETKPLLHGSGQRGGRGAVR